MPLLYLIRHPHTRIDLDRPAHDWDLSDTGRAQVTALSRAPFWKHIAAVCASSEAKALRPAEQIAAVYGLPVMALPALGEVDRGGYRAPDQAAYAAAVEAFFTQPEASPHGWERAADALARFRQGIAEALSGAPPTASIAAFSHGLVLTLYLAHLRGEPPSLAAWRALGFCAVAAVDRATMQPLAGFVGAAYEQLPLPPE